MTPSHPEIDPPSYRRAISVAADVSRAFLSDQTSISHHLGNDIFKYIQTRHGVDLPCKYFPVGPEHLPIGNIGIPLTTIPGVASRFALEGGAVNAKVFTVLMDRNDPRLLVAWDKRQYFYPEQEFVALHFIERREIPFRFSAWKIDPLVVGDIGMPPKLDRFPIPRRTQ